MARQRGESRIGRAAGGRCRSNRGLWCWAALGFLLAALVATGGISRQLAVIRAQNYLSRRLGAFYDIPVDRVTLTRVSGSPKTGKPLPPFGLCWQIELRSGQYVASVMINPFTGDVVDYRLRTLAASAAIPG